MPLKLCSRAVTSQLVLLFGRRCALQLETKLRSAFTPEALSVTQSGAGILLFSRRSRGEIRSCQVLSYLVKMIGSMQGSMQGLASILARPGFGSGDVPTKDLLTAIPTYPLACCARCFTFPERLPLVLRNWLLQAGPALFQPFNFCLLCSHVEGWMLSVSAPSPNLPRATFCAFHPPFRWPHAFSSLLGPATSMPTIQVSNHVAG